MSNKIKNHVLKGQLFNDIGHGYEDEAIKAVVREFDKDSLITKNIIMDFATLTDKGLSVIEAKYYEDPPRAMAKAIKSFDKVSNDIKKFELKTITPAPETNENIHFKRSQKDREFKNSWLPYGLVTDLQNIINLYFADEEIIKDMYKWVFKDEYKDELDKLNDGLESQLSIYFINVYDIYKKLVSVWAQFKNKAAAKLSKGQVSAADIERAKIKVYFSTIRGKDENK